MTDQQAAQAEQTIGPISLMAPVGLPRPPRAPRPHETWDLPGGTAWVYYGDNNTELTRPVILADGFDTGRSDLDWLYDGLERKDFPFVSELNRRDRDLVIRGWRDRSASILDNGDTAIAAINEAISRRVGSEPLMVGGFSMGGLVTRYALAKMEHHDVDHQTATYLSYDSPHRGAWVPIGLQAFAHYLKPADATFSNQINSPAARQLLRWHLDSVDGTPREDPMRTALLAELAEIGGWPQRPRLLGVANGTGDGAGNGVPPGVAAIDVTGPIFRGTSLLTQAAGDNRKVATLRSFLPGSLREIFTSGLPECDGAPGGTLETFGIIGDKLNEKGQADVHHRMVCFVPSVSAVAVRDIDTDADLYADITSMSPDASDLDDFRCAARAEAHTSISRELCEWIIERLPE
jgi:hypothetical protein